MGEPENALTALQVAINEDSVEFNSKKQLQAVVDRLIDAIPNSNNAASAADGTAQVIAQALAPQLIGDDSVLSGGPGGPLVVHPVYKSSTLLLVHIVCMAVAWPLLASVAIFMASHFRFDQPKSHIGGKPLWYQVHRLFMILVVILTVVGTVAVFAMQDGYIGVLDGNTSAKSHAPIGIAVLCLTCLNPALAAFRPPQEAPGRMLFDWFHWLIGQTDYGLAMLDIFLGMSIPRANFLTPDWLIWMLGVFIVFHIIIELGLIAELKYHEGKLREEESSVLVSEMGVHHISQTAYPDYPLKPARRHLVRRAITVVYIVCAGLMGVVFICTVFLENQARS